MESSFLLPGTIGPQILVRRPSIGGIKVFVDGKPVRPSSRRRLRYKIPLTDGTSTEMDLVGQWTGLRAVANGSELALERRLAPWEVVLTFLPLALVAIGGLLGGLFAIGAAAVNSRLARSGARPPIRALSMLGVTALATTLFFGTAVAIAPIASLKTGTCLNNVEVGATIDTGRTVRCDSAHENEVVGTAVYPGSGAFPDMDTLVEFAQVPCFDAFRSYVGVDFQASALDMIVVVPSDLAWAKGDRSLACVILTTDGSRITGTVKGTGR